MATADDGDAEELMRAHRAACKPLRMSQRAHPEPQDDEELEWLRARHLADVETIGELRRQAREAAALICKLGMENDRLRGVSARDKRRKGKPVDELERFTTQYVLDGEGNPVAEPDLVKWAEWLQVHDRVVAFVETPKGTIVSTCFLGVDCSFGHPMGPVLWETAIFREGTDNPVEVVARYPSREAALAGHAVALGEVRKEEGEE